ncbi:hypothetical protein LX15_002376 [Streptoalloteichus tenebrarius]|uniref:Transposase n=1 Tax=Streptoalloteichus tenebrarius (strain ATCC 17920 / DSM 40477 / JCM 4838 / CBS 697.72 / NBRC 16177 / NCIMB 11028 / NRRL B-12390 / A12253. 1 / ISP 5477) TaxID=1933 RepID=A0ABT1HT25_STRSD|nr:hypothetical protein [Streptoalloteichus tenebrarius]MCP2258678.1 hypothetical protein [Streptoalloteichus tenebrarius]BFF02823.1 hypothetical protein GCM10020241_44980 [Streptoalloteichus tenebrarius]
MLVGAHDHGVDWAFQSMSPSASARSRDDVGALRTAMEQQTVVLRSGDADANTLADWLSALRGTRVQLRRRTSDHSGQ